MSEICRTICSRSVFLALFQHLLQLIADVEVIFDGLLAAAGDDDDLVAAGGHGLFHAVLNDGLVHQGSISLGCALVAGRKRVPSPAAGKTALRTFIGIVFLLSSCSGIWVMADVVRKDAAADCN